MPPRAAKKTKTSGEAKKASAPPKSKSDKGKEPVEDSEDEGDDEEDEDEEDLDGSDGYDDLIMVDFDFCDVQENDFHSLKALLRSYCEGDEYACSDLCDLLIKQKAVGTVVKVEGQDDSVLGVTSVVSLRRHKEEQCVKDIKKFILGKAQGKDKKELERILNDESTGLIVNERIINVPQQTGGPLIEGVFDEIQWATKDEETPEVRKSYDFKYYVVLSTMFEEDVEDESGGSGKKRKKGQPKKERIFPRLEEEVMLEHAKMSFTWRSKQDESNDIADFIPQRYCIVLEAASIPKFRSAAKEIFSELEDN